MLQFMVLVHSSKESEAGQVSYCLPNLFLDALAI